MRRGQRSWVYLLFVLLTGVQLGLFVLTGVVTHVSARGSALMLLLVGLLAVGSRIVWALLVLLDGIPLLAALLAPLGTSSGPGHVLWAHLAVMLVTSAALEATLLSPPMRRFVRSPRTRRHSGRPALH